MMLVPKAESPDFWATAKSAFCPFGCGYRSRKSTRLGVRSIWFRSCLQHFLAVWFWACCLISGSCFLYIVWSLFTNWKLLNISFWFCFLITEFTINGFVFSSSCILMRPNSSVYACCFFKKWHSIIIEPYFVYSISSLSEPIFSCKW